jgi:hypothetical protein
VIDTTNPFETFTQSAFRLEALPQYLVEDEKEAFERFKATGDIPKILSPEWASLVETNTKSGKTMKRLRLISDELTPYEQFELQIYSGLGRGEDIRLNSRQLYASEYHYDFWFFDNAYIAQVNYEADGTFLNFDIREATDEEKAAYNYWLSIFEQSIPLSS